MQKLKVNPLIYRAFPLYFLDSCFLFLLKIKYVFPLIVIPVNIWGKQNLFYICFG